MMVNMIVGCDWSYPFGNALSIAQINGILLGNKMGYKIPLNWNPQSFDL